MTTFNKKELVEFIGNKNFTVMVDGEIVFYTSEELEKDIKDSDTFEASPNYGHVNIVQIGGPYRVKITVEHQCKVIDNEWTI